MLLGPPTRYEIEYSDVGFASAPVDNPIREETPKFES